MNRSVKPSAAVPLAIIHGKNDPVMGFGMGQYAATLFGEAGWPAFHFFTDDNGRSHVRPPPGWPRDPLARDDVVERSQEADRLRRRARRQGRLPRRDRRTRPRQIAQAQTPRRRNAPMMLTKTIDAKAAPGAAKYSSLIRRRRTAPGSTGSWPIATNSSSLRRHSEVMAAFAELRKSHDSAAKKAFGEARRLFQQGKQDEGYAKYKEIVEKDYASSLYRIVKRWLDERK